MKRLITWWQERRREQKEVEKASVWKRVCSRVEISDYEYEGQTVLALLVDDTMVDYVRECTDVDPEGYWLCDSVATLIKKMELIRKEEERRYWKERRQR